MRIHMLQIRAQHDKVQNEQSGDHPENRMDLFGLLFADLYDAVCNEAESDTVRNAVAKGHEQAGKECGNSLGEIGPRDFP